MAEGASHSARGLAQDLLVGVLRDSVLWGEACPGRRPWSQVPSSGFTAADLKEGDGTQEGEHL